MKAQTRIKLNDFAVMPTVAEEGAYVNLAWDDVGETYTPLKKGSAVTVTLETIINDDLRAVQQIPKKLSRAAVMTINAVIVALFTDTSGTGPALADTYHIFDASHHQSNLGSTALNATTLEAGMLAIAKMTDTASHRLGLRGKWLLIPPDLEYTAYTLLYSQLKPGTADNDVNALSGRCQHIVVPGFTDANNWYLLADPSQAELIEVGYLNDQRTPELMVQDDPTAGSVFTNDYITYKIRWIFGAGWLDYRGAYGAVVT
jgi:phage major head subunit gpT-like protein